MSVILFPSKFPSPDRLKSILKAPLHFKIQIFFYLILICKYEYRWIWIGILGMILVGIGRNGIWIYWWTQVGWGIREMRCEIAIWKREIWIWRRMDKSEERRNWEIIGEMDWKRVKEWLEAGLRFRNYLQI